MEERNGTELKTELFLKPTHTVCRVVRHHHPQHKFETLAVKKALGEDVAKKMYISSTKGATGHTLGAAGGIEAIATVLAVQTKTLPPTINYATPDPDCDLNVVPNKPITLPEVKAAASQSAGFGGHDSVVVFKPYQG